MRRATLGKTSKGTRAYGSTQPVTLASGVRPRGGLSVSALAGLGEASGRMLGPYELVELLGKGSFGYVYRARHTVLGRSVAIKVLSHELATDASSVGRFVAEARAVNLLDHANVLDVTDIVLSASPGEVPWIVMELLEGSDLAHMMTGKPGDLLESLRIVRDVCQGLEAIHDLGIVHRDIKPENIFIARIEQRDIVKLIDFGIALLPGELSVEPVIMGELIGTPIYMAPEQTGTRVIDHRADLYAVGALLLELLTGEPPFGNDDLAVQLEQLLHKEPPLASSRITLPKAVRDDVDWLIARCLQKRPEDRPATARAVIVDIDRILHTLATAEKMETLARLSSAPPPHRDRRRIAYTVAGVAVMVAVALGAVLAAKWIGSTLPPAAGTVGRDTHEPSPVVAPPPPTAAPSALPPSATEVREAPEAHAVTVAKHLDAPAKQPASRGPRRTARRARDVGPRRVEIPLIAVPEKTESATDADTRTIRPTAPPAPQLLELRRADEAR